MAPPAQSRKRRAPQPPSSDDEDSSSTAEDNPRPTQRSRNTQQPPLGRTRASSADSSASREVENGRNDSTSSSDTQLPSATQIDITQAVKQLVRLALSAEHRRQPLRRSEIATKAIGPHSRSFQRVFDAAQLALRDTFGMELVELPAREKVTVAQRRKALQSASNNAVGQSTQRRGRGGGGGADEETQQPQSETHGGAGSSGNKAWILVSVLPAKYRTSEILGPSQAPTHAQEAAYSAFATFVVTLISLAGGTLGEEKLERQLRRVAAERATPVGDTDKVLLRMAKDGYIMRVREAVGGGEVEGIEYVVGPRGRVEVGKEGVAGLVRTVWGLSGDGSSGRDEELESKIERSLRLGSGIGGLIAKRERQTDRAAGPG